MSLAAAEKRNEEDIDVQLLALHRAYKNAGKNVALTLLREDSTTRGRRHYTLQADGFTVTSWAHTKSVDVWLALLDMRRAVEVLSHP